MPDLTTPAWSVGAASAAGYLLGSLPTARWVAGRRGVDPLVAGERNPGATNVWRLGGARAGMAVLAGDVAKGALAGAVGLALGGWWAGCAGVVFAMAGHAWPVWSSFRGGRSVACLVGGGLILSPLAAAIALALFVIVIKLIGLWRAAAAGLLAYPPLFALLAQDRWRLVGIGSAYLVLLAAWRSSSRRASRPAGPIRPARPRATTAPSRRH
ncbi:MAG TPA: glycerol-3-phosphate acyltransferase [Patescibacteria group bacterium]|nr:glycerol-3-phosphate acyltransferase [Patescibacteria group bacterium]